MNLLKRSTYFILLMLLSLIIVACSSKESDDSATDQNEDKTEQTDEQQASGGELNIAINAAPPTLDQPTSTATAARDTSRLIFESLFATDSDFNPVPVLAESIESDDNQTYTIKIREGVKFHNGKEMTSEDVVASMERWVEVSSVTGNVFEGATWTAEDDYTVVLELANPSSLTLDTMASAKQAAGIMPKEIVESAPAEGVEEYIGTGPYKFVEWKHDQYIHFTKFEDYESPEGESDGLVGKKEALVDDIYFHIVPDTSTRIAGLQTGEYDFAYGIPYDNYDMFEEDPNFETILTPAANALLGFNNVEGISTNFKMRQAINAALDMEEVMMAAFPNEAFFWLDSGYMDVNIKTWLTDAGSEYYNQADPEKAKQYLDEMGYDGEVFRIMATRDYDHHYNMALVIHDQLLNAGINAELEIYDWPTVLDIQNNEFDQWDSYITTASTVSTPSQLIALSPKWAGGTYDEVSEMVTAMETAPTIEEATEIWDELQLHLWEEVLPIVHLGGYNSLEAYNKKVQGIRSLSGPIFWNVSISE